MILLLLMWLSQTWSLPDVVLQNSPRIENWGHRKNSIDIRILT